MYGQDLTLLQDAPTFVRRIVEKGRLVHDGDGTFARVFAIDSRTVLKITTCQATRDLYDQLIQHPVAGCVKVLRAYGVVAVDEDDFPFYAFVVERLFGQKEWQSLPSVSKIVKKRKTSSHFCENEGKRHRVSTHKHLRGHLQKRRWGVKRESRQTLEMVLQRIRRPIKSNLTRDGRQKGSTLFYQLRKKLGLEMEDALEMLYKFVSHREAELDLLRDNNIMWTRDGRLCFSDPVTVMYDNTLPSTTPSPDTGETFLGLFKVVHDVEDE